MKQIPLTQGKFALVDDEDFEELSKYRWYLSRSGYANRHPKMINGVRRGKISMHRQVMDMVPSGKMPDHINGNRIDNRKSNLRLATPSQNTINSSLYTNNTSGFKGVSWWNSANSYTARIQVNGKRLFLGYFKSVDDAARAYREAAIKHFGEYARF